MGFECSEVKKIYQMKKNCDRFGIIVDWLAKFMSEFESDSEGGSHEKGVSQKNQTENGIHFSNYLIFHQIFWDKLSMNGINITQYIGFTHFRLILQN